MKYRLSTLFFLAVIVALTVGWYVDRPPALKARLQGAWRYPFPGVGHWETLYFEPQGEFRRVIRYRMGRDEFHGKFEVTAENQLHFRFEECWDSQDQAMRPLSETELKHSEFWMRCGFGAGGQLLLVNLDPYPTKPESAMEPFLNSRNYERGEY